MENGEATSWKAAQAERWLRVVGKVARERDELRARAEALRAAADGVRAIDYSKGGSSGAPSDGAASAALDALESAALLDDLAREAGERVTDALMRLAALDDADRMLLEDRYVHGMAWLDISNVLGFSYSYTRGFIKMRALRAAYEVMPHHERVRIPRADCS